MSEHFGPKIAKQLPWCRWKVGEVKEDSSEIREDFKMSKTDPFPYFPFVGDFVAEQEVIDGSSYWSGYYTALHYTTPH